LVWISAKPDCKPTAKSVVFQSQDVHRIRCRTE
jgi:hypothetical protein